MDMDEKAARVFATKLTAVLGLAAAGLMSLGCTGGGDRRPSGTAGSTTNVEVPGSAGTTGSAGSGGGGGSTGSAGTTESSAGTTGSAGSGGSPGSAGVTGTTGSAGVTGSAGATGAAGAIAVVPPCAAPSSALVTDFGTGKSTVGTPYKGADVGLAAPMVSVTGGALVIKLDTGPPSTDYPYAYVGLPFNACTGAAAYTGVKFNIGGTLSTGCRVVFSAVDAAHSTVANHGTCKAANCYPSAAGIELPATPTDVTVLFGDQSGGGADPEVVERVDPNHLLNLQWQFNLATGDAGGCSGTVTIDNISFL
jgi:hypothetical protein